MVCFTRFSTYCDMILETSICLLTEINQSQFAHESGFPLLSLRGPLLPIWGSPILNISMARPIASHSFTARVCLSLLHTFLLFSLYSVYCVVMAGGWSKWVVFHQRKQRHKCVQHFICPPSLTLSFFPPTLLYFNPDCDQQIEAWAWLRAAGTNAGVPFLLLLLSFSLFLSNLSSLSPPHHIFFQLFHRHGNQWPNQSFSLISCH